MSEDRQSEIEEIIGNKLDAIISFNDANKQTINEILNNIATLWEAIDLSFDLISKDNKNYVIFKFRDSEGSICKGSCVVTLEELAASIYGILDKIENGRKAIKVLNNAMKKRQYEHGAPLNINYKWSITKQCSIGDWDYNNIKIKLNDMALERLTEEFKKDGTGAEVEKMVAELVWDGNIINFVREFDKFKLHAELGLSFGVCEVGKILTENMLGTSDVLSIIRKQSKVSGVQKFKSIFKVSELGKFLVILIWDVDYNKKSIVTSILGDKALDIENSRFISDYNLFSRIESRASISKEIIDSVFLGND